MNKEKLIANWDDLKDETKARILNLADNEIGKEYFVPEIDEYYSCYDNSCSKGGIGAVKRLRSNGSYDMFNEETGNCFRTREEAEFAGQCEWFTKRFETYVNRHSEKLDWNNDKQCKFYTYNEFQKKHIYYDVARLYKQQGTSYASSEQILKDAIADIGEENFLKYVMKVEK